MDVESKEEGGYTVLQWASWVGGLEIVKLLVEGMVNVCCSGDV